MALNFIHTVIQDTELQGDSLTWANWMSRLTLTTCEYCVEHHGKIVDISILDYKISVDAHQNCKCVYVPMRTKKVGTATDMEKNGADVQIFYSNKLPDYYVKRAYAEDTGFRNNRGNLDKVLPGKMIGGDIYKNKNGKLPSAPGRVWHEADINYDKGYRNRQRILYSNDGLVFVTYDHYHTFYEIIK